MASSNRRKRADSDADLPAATPPSLPPPPTRRSQRRRLHNSNINNASIANHDHLASAASTTTTIATAAVAVKKEPTKANPKPAGARAALGKAEPSADSGSTVKDEPEHADLSCQAQDAGGFWLMKSEPNVFSYDDLCKHDGPAGWDGVRNHVAKNHIRSMKVGDKAFFYHSNCKEPGIVAVMEITREASVDESQFDPKAEYYDPKAVKSNPRWYLVHCSPVRKLERQIGLAELRAHSGNGGALAQMVLFRQSRLSVSPVSAAEFQFILSLEDRPEGKDAN